MGIPMRRIGLLAVISALVFGSIQPLAAKPEAGVYACTFERGNAWLFEKGAYAERQPERVAFSISRVDMGAQTARLGTGEGAAALRTVQALSARHFIEVAGEGFLNITTIYDRDDVSGRYPAVHSRHFAVLGQPLVAQYRGFCDRKP